MSCNETAMTKRYDNFLVISTEGIGKFVGQNNSINFVRQSNFL